MLSAGPPCWTCAVLKFNLRWRLSHVVRLPWLFLHPVPNIGQGLLELGSFLANCGGRSLSRILLSTYITQRWCPKGCFAISVLKDSKRRIGSRIRSFCCQRRSPMKTLDSLCDWLPQLSVPPSSRPLETCFFYSKLLGIRCVCVCVSSTVAVF